MTQTRKLGLLLVVGMLGCSAGDKPGSEAAARKYFDGEFQKWIAGQENTITTMDFRTRALQTPLTYDVRSVATDKPDPLAFDKAGDLPNDWKLWPVYKFNVAIEWKSEAGTPLTKVTTYTLTWNSHEQKWYVQERF